MGKQTLKLAARRSKLAQVQVEEALERIRPLFPDAAFEQVALDTPGDRDLTTPLSDTQVPDDFFTSDLDQALIDTAADIAVHSAKDLPATMRDGLTVAALLPSRDIRDAIVVREDHDVCAPPGVIGTSSPRREDAIKEWYPEAQARAIRGAITERLDMLDRGEYDAVIVAACALERLGLAHRITRYLPYDPAPQQGRLALVTRSQAVELRTVLKTLDVRRKAGLVAIVGCPADASLLSGRAGLYLKHADVVLHDRLLPDQMLLHIHGKAVPVGKVAGEERFPQSEVHRLLLAEAEQGKLVVRLQGGDPSVFGHLAEELQFLQDWNIRTDLVPAVTAAQVASAHAGAPLTHRKRGRGVVVMSGRPADMTSAGRAPGPSEGNLAIYMGVERLRQIAAELALADWPADTPVVAAERMGYKDEEVHYTTLEELPDLTVKAPTVLLVGSQLFPREDTTLFVGTDPGHFLRHGPLVHWPLIRLIVRPLEERVAHCQEHLADVKGVILPGRFAVHSFISALMHIGDTRLLTGKQLLAVGPATAEELAAWGLRADLTAASLGGMRDLAKSLTAEFQGRYLYPCSDAAPQAERAAFLADFGIELRPAVFYSNRAMPYRDLPRMPFARVLFTSTSTVNVYFENYPGELNASRTWIAVGPSTQRALQERGLESELLE